MLNSRLVSFAARLGATAVLAISIPSNVVAEGVFPAMWWPKA